MGNKYWSISKQTSLIIFSVLKGDKVWNKFTLIKVFNSTNLKSHANHTMS